MKFPSTMTSQLGCALSWICLETALNPPLDLQTARSQPVFQPTISPTPRFTTHTSSPSTVPPPPIGNIVQVFQTPDKTIRKYSGYSHEDGRKFLSEFESYLVLANIDPVSPRAVACFHLHIQGPALVWFNSLPDTNKLSWSTVRSAFLQEFCPPDGPGLVAEEAIFSHLRLDSQPIEDYHSMIMEKGRRLGKTDRDMLMKFVDGLPQQLAFFIRAGRVNTFREALHFAKLGEAHGYRSQNSIVGAATGPSQPEGVQRQLDTITRRLDDLCRDKPQPSRQFSTPNVHRMHHGFRLQI